MAKHLGVQPAETNQNYAPLFTGMHKHFRMINLHRHFNKHSHTPCTIAELWERLDGMYDLGTLDEREDSGLFVDENEDEESDEEQDISFKNSEEFVLPLHDYDHLVKEVFREPSRNPSPSPIRTTRAREGSQTPSVADSSRASSPDEDDLPRKRRASRAVKKSDVNETPSPRTSATPSSSTRRTTRAKAPEAAPVTRRKTGKKAELKVFDEFCRARSNGICNIPKGWLVGIFDVSKAEDMPFLWDKFGVTLRKYPHLVILPSGFNHTSESGNITMYTLLGIVEARTAQKLCEAFRVKTYTEVVQKIIRVQCNVIFSQYEAWANGVRNGQADVQRVPALKFLRTDGTTETYNGKCDDLQSLEAWIKARLPKSNSQLDEIRVQFHQATTEEEKKTLFGQGVQTTLEVSSMGEDVEDCFSFFGQALESLAAMPVAEAPKEEL
ncbi:hypothetical protein BGZ70_008751 [Mortierella alpina]|uniref:Uncharacterized protein n=1 Tax=Mortierella alpina TaxID=64518 RepID=A0A9P6M1D5_MORAP|nr:hypothetical protein BGZ70_008751 [Mortierella alpina]